jgi:hypothetical protein
MGMVFTAALWYGQYLIKTECRAYSAGILVVVSQKQTTCRYDLNVSLDIYCMFEYHLVSQSTST